jgi:hypothetical protein
MLTGSDAPSNQLANLATDALDLCFCMVGLVPSTSNSAASRIDTLSGELFLLGDRSDGRNVESRVGEDDGVRAKSGGRSTVVLERRWLLPLVGGGSLIAGPSFSSKGAPTEVISFRSIMHDDRSVRQKWQGFRQGRNCSWQIRCGSTERVQQHRLAQRQVWKSCCRLCARLCSYISILSVPADVKQRGTRAGLWLLDCRLQRGRVERHVPRR